MGYGVLPSTGVHKNCVRGTWGDTYAYYFKLTVTVGPRAFWEGGMHKEEPFFRFGK